MKILKQGRTPEEELYRGTCSYCKTEIECEQHELTAQDDCRNGTLWWVECPHCADCLDHRIYCEKVDKPCPHNRVQQFTECCLDCGKNIYE